MEDKKLLIVGVDPGITTAYAVLDIYGSLIIMNSSKEFDLNSLISEVINLGRVVLVGTDKFKVPALVQAFATKIGAGVISPKEDLKVEEKKASTSDSECSNEHERDALASAFFAYRSAKPLLDKIDFFVEENQKQDIRSKLKELVVLKKISIRSAVDILEKANEVSSIMKKVVYEKKLSEQDFMRLYNRLKKNEAELKLVRSYNVKLVKRLGTLQNKGVEPKPGAESKSIEYRESRLRFLSSLVKLKDNEIKDLKSSIEKVNSLLLNINEFYILKKLGTFGINEFNLKNKILHIQRNDILLVDNPNIISPDVIEDLKGKVFLIIHKEPISKKNESRLPFIFIESKNLNIQDHSYFGVVERKYLDAEKSKVGWVKKIVEDYRKEKLVLR